MPKPIVLALAAVALALAACNNGAGSFAITTPAPTPTPSYSPNPAITAAPVVVTALSTPLPNQVVYETTPDPNGHPGIPSSAIATQTTGDGTNGTVLGQTIFTNLNPTQAYCWQSVYTAPGGQPQTFSKCTLFWQSGIHLGT